MYDAKEILDLVRNKWSLNEPKERYELPNGKFETGTLPPWVGTGVIITEEKHSGEYAVDITDTYTEQTLSQAIPKSVIDSFKLYAYGNGSIKVTLTFSDETSKSGIKPLDFEWKEINILTWVIDACTGELLFPADKSIKKIKIEGLYVIVYVDDVELTVDGDLYLALDEFNPNFPLYQLVFINKPERILFVSPNVNKLEQSVSVDIYCKLSAYDNAAVEANRIIFKAVKEELVRIFNANRFDTVGLVINMSSFVDGKLPHGFGEEAEPLMLTSRMTIECSEYKALDGTLVGMRLGSVTILDNDLLGLLDVSWIDTNPFVKVRIPKGPQTHQHLIGPEVEGEIIIHDYCSLYKALYATQIGTSGLYPINVDNSKSEFSTNPEDPKFIVTMFDHEGNTYVFNFLNVTIKQVELLSSSVSGLSENRWKIKWQADYIYPVPYQPT